MNKVFKKFINFTNSKVLVFGSGILAVLLFVAVFCILIIADNKKQ